MRLTLAKKVKNMDKATEAVLAAGNSKSQKMKDLFQLGYDIKEIAALMGVRYNFVYNVISNQIIVEGLDVFTEKKVSKKDAVRDLFIQGKTNKEIAIELKTNYNYIYKLTKELKDELAELNQIPEIK